MILTGKIPAEKPGDVTEGVGPGFQPATPRFTGTGITHGRIPDCSPAGIAASEPLYTLKNGDRSARDDRNRQLTMSETDRRYDSN
jgi:hypothetical protein